MGLPAYDIFQKQDGALMWVEPAEDLETAKKRAEQLAKQRRGEYVIFDQTRQQIVATLNPAAD
jgi:hypothetical protein